MYYKIEHVHTQYLKRVLGCNYNTSNIMTRGEVGARPLLLQVIKRVIAYIRNIKDINSSLVNIAFQYESESTTEPNLRTFVDKFNLNASELVEKSKHEVKKICHDNYDRYWFTMLSVSPKALSYMLFKKYICLERYLYQ